ncbi:hypothetical protein [Botrimarina hoheduenensis]|uniref:Uncharacterized protein n=1 Tax=Botrimarina hoheduenensis TaxID=2528000 RepID=A0A5C5W8W0_9BACT|nr:hypothetical protein [Botrimarina hoheduenensis]TWT47328.1 hypothetical protein Pla111_09410 [Botrimarina hoheduenensis]
MLPATVLPTDRFTPAPESSLTVAAARTPESRTPESVVRRAEKQSLYEQYRVVTQRGQTIAPPVLERLEELDDALFAALDGDPAALDGFIRQWKAARGSTPDELLEDSRRHYVRHARARAANSMAQRLLETLGEQDRPQGLE